MTLTAEARRFAATLCSFPLHGVTDEVLAEVVDSWLADEFASEAHQHIHGWNDDESTSHA